MRLETLPAAALLGFLMSSSVGIADVPSGGGRGEAVIRGEGAAVTDRYLVSASRCGERLSTEWRHLDGSMAASEEVELAEGRWVRYRLQRTNVGQDLRAERRGDVVTITDGGRPARASIKVSGRGTLLAGPELVFFLQSRLSELRAGRSVTFQYLLVDRGTTLGFVARGTVEGAATRVTLEPSSVLAKPFVPTTRFLFAEDGGLREVVGRMLPVVGSTAAPKPLDGVLRMTAAQSSCNRKSLS
jgi:hypothetical protein